MELTLKEKIKLIIKRKKLTMIGLSEAMGFSRQNLSQRLWRNSWTSRELERIADILGCDLEITFIDRQTGERF